MRIPAQAKSAVRKATPWLKAITTVAIAGAILSAGFFPWTAKYIILSSTIPGEYQSIIRYAIALTLGAGLAATVYLAIGHRSVNTTVIAFVMMLGYWIVLALILGIEERVGASVAMALLACPVIAAVATKAAKIASEKKGDKRVLEKGWESFNEALSDENMAELFLWTVAWAAGGIGVFVLSKTIEAW